MDKPRLRDVLQNNWSARFKNVKVMKDKVGLRKSSLLEKTRDMIIKCFGILDCILGN